MRIQSYENRGSQSRRSEISDAWLRSAANHVLELLILTANQGLFENEDPSSARLSSKPRNRNSELFIRLGGVHIAEMKYDLQYVASDTSYWGLGGSLRKTTREEWQEFIKRSSRSKRQDCVKRT